jgi:tetratricopeptide (TPR) repeat protein
MLEPPGHCPGGCWFGEANSPDQKHEKLLAMAPRPRKNGRFSVESCRAALARLSWTRTRSIIGELSSFAAQLLWLLVAIWLVTVVIISLASSTTEIGEISVPKTLSDKGYTPEIAARRLRDIMKDLTDSALGRYDVPKNQMMKGATIALNFDAPNIVVPTVGVSLSTVTTSIRSLLGFKWHQTISGEFLVKNDRLWLRLRKDGVSFYASETGADIESPDDLLQSAAAEIFSKIQQPYVAAATESDPQKAIERAKQGTAQLLESNENVVWCYILEGELYGQLKQYADAEAALTKASQLGARHSGPHFILGNIFLQQNDRDSAIKEYSTAISIDKTIAAAFNNRAIAYDAKDDHDHAMADLNEAIRLKPEAIEALTNRGNAYEKKHDHDHAIADFNEAIRLNPKFETFFDRGIAYEAKLDHDHAIADFSEAIRLNPKVDAPFIGRGNAYEAKREHDHAIADFSEAIRLNPKVDATFISRGNAYEAKDEHDHAIADFSEAIRLNPKVDTTFISRANVYVAKRDFDHAIADLNEAIRLNPKTSAIFFARGIAYEIKGEHDHAIADYDEAIRLNPSFLDAYRNRGEVYERKNDYARAALDYEEVTRLQPGDADAWNRRCWTRAIIGQLQQALQDCNESLRLQPDDADSIDSRGFTYLRLDELDKAIADYDAALKLNPKLAGSLYGRGLARLKKGDTGGGNADVSAAKAIQSDIAEEYARFDVK